ncbi:hypothetical protein XENORESO_016669, partial [Xenotaenia resolanae]
MASEFLQRFYNLAFSVGQQLVFSFSDKLFNLVVKDIEAMDASILREGKMSDASGKKIKVGLLLTNSQVVFEKSENSAVVLI